MMSPAEVIEADRVSAPPESGTQAEIETDVLPMFTLGDHVEVATEYARSLGEHAVHDDGAAFTYDAARGLFVDLHEADESCRVQRYSGAPIDEDGDKTKSLKLGASDISGIVKLAHHRLARRRFFASARPGLALADAFVEITSRGVVIRTHAPEHRARYGYPFPTSALTAPTRFLAFLGQLFEGDEDGGAKIDLVQEIAGAALLGVAAKYQRCAVLLGTGANGKSTLLTILRGAFPPRTVVAVPPQRWEDQYRRAVLAGALLNAVSELPENDILESETVKAVISGDEVEGRQPYKPVFHFVPRAAHLFAANRLPASSDTSEGFWRRFIVVAFNRRFEGEDANANLADEILEHERAGIVGWLLKGGVRLMHRGRYELPPSSAAIVASWRHRSNPVALFFGERVELLAPHEEIEKHGALASTLYESFRAWAEANGHKAITSTKFGMRARELCTSGPTKSRAGWRYPVRLRVGAGLCRVGDGLPAHETRGGLDA